MVGYATLDGDEVQPSMLLKILAWVGMQAYKEVKDEGAGACFGGSLASGEASGVHVALIGQGREVGDMPQSAKKHGGEAETQSVQPIIQDHYSASTLMDEGWRVSGLWPSRPIFIHFQWSWVQALVVEKPICDKGTFGLWV